MTATATFARRNPGCITAGEYRRVQRHMTLSKVKAIVGSRGTIRHGDIALHVRRWISCATVDGDHVDQCMLLRRKERSNGTWSPARVASKNVAC